MDYNYEINPRPVELGGGVFPPDGGSETTMEDALQAAYDDAESEAYAWLDSRKA